MSTLKHIQLFGSRDALDLARIIDQALENPALEIKAVWCGASADQTSWHYAILGVKSAPPSPPVQPPQHGGKRR